MKIRNGFVSNSSSSSFVCHICEREEEGFGLELDDVGMNTCEGGHTFCDSHKTAEVDRKNINDIRGFLLVNRWIEDDDKEISKSMSDGEIKEFFEEKYDTLFRWESPSILCPVCNFGEISTDEALIYFLSKNNLTMKSFADKMRDEFKYKDDFLKYISNE
jgi:hypothetical protein